MAWITADDLIAALSLTTYHQIFADDPTSAVINDAAVALVLEGGEADANGYLRLAYDDEFPPDTPIPPEFRTLSLDFARARAYERHPEYVRTLAADLRAWAERRGEALVMGRRRGTATQPNPTPSLAEAPPYGGAAAAGFVAVGGDCYGCGCTPSDWWRKEDCS